MGRTITDLPTFLCLFCIHKAYALPKIPFDVILPMNFY